MLHGFNFLQRSALQNTEKYTGKTRRCLVKYLSVGRMLQKTLKYTQALEEFGMFIFSI